MKTLPGKELFAWIALVCAIVLFSITVSFAQSEEGNVGIHIEKEVNGKTESYDTTFTANDDNRIGNPPFVFPKINPVPFPDTLPRPHFYDDSAIYYKYYSSPQRMSEDIHAEIKKEMEQLKGEMKDMKEQMKTLHFELKGDDNDDHDYNFHYKYFSDPGSVNEGSFAFPNMPDFNDFKDSLKNFHLDLNLDSLSRKIHIIIDDKLSLVDKSQAEPSNDIKPGIAENTLQIDNLNIYPNPSDGQFSVNFNLKEKGDLKITITDIDGKVIFSEKLKDFTGDYSNLFDMRDKGSGIYILSIEQNKKLLTKKIALN